MELRSLKVAFHHPSGLTEGNSRTDYSLTFAWVPFLLSVTCYLLMRRLTRLRRVISFFPTGITSTLSRKPQRYSYKGVDRCVLDPRCLWWSQSTVLANRSLISHYVLGAYWNWLVTLWPVSVAPNTVGHRNIVWGFQEELIFYVDRSQWLAWSSSFSAFSQCFITIPCILRKNNLKGRQVLHIWCISRMSNPLWKSFFPWAQPCCPIVTQMGHRLVSVSELRCYRWVYIRLTQMSLQISHECD